MNKTLVLVPTYNESQNIERVYGRIFKHAKGCDLLFIDDNSPDGTGEIAERIARRDRRVKVLHRPEKGGLGTAYIEGLRRGLAAGYRYIVAMDADLQHDPVSIPRMLDLMKDYDLVIGSRYVTGGVMANWGRGRVFISALANLLARWILGLSPRDCTGGYKCYKADLLRKVDLGGIYSRGYVFQVEILHRLERAGARVAEVPIIFRIRHFGASKLSVGELLHFGWTILRLRLSA
jgi:glycosyltransferase involved in cell wall biosynthesis